MNANPLSTSPLGAPPAAPSGGPLVLARDLRLTLAAASGPVNVLRGVDLAIGPGEAVGIVGPSGSGKTSLLMLLAGLERATSGRIVVAGEDLTTLSEDALARFRRNKIGIVFQSFHLIPTMTALENVALPLEFGGARDAFDRAAVSLQAVGLGHRLRHLPGQLSGGEQQRVAVARAFAPSPRLLLADEPTGNLDTATGRAVMDLLFDMRVRAGSTLMLITHDPALAARCDRQVRMADGLIADGPLQERTLPNGALGAAA
jgi:putative ABC transport system ATP-binding protein